jgi:hypothetical protein
MWLDLNNQPMAEALLPRASNNSELAGFSRHISHTFTTMPRNLRKLLAVD